MSCFERIILHKSYPFKAIGLILIDQQFCKVFVHSKMFLGFFFYCTFKNDLSLISHPYNSNEIYFLQNHVALCTLHSNALYVKLFFVIYFWNSFLVLITLFGLLYSVLTSMLYVRALTLCMGTKLKWERMMILASKLGVWIIWYCIYTIYT